MSDVDTGTAARLEAGAELELVLDRLEARLEARQFSLQARRTSPRRELWWQ